MHKTARDRIRRIFVSRQSHFSQITAADLLGMSFAKLRREMADGTILTISTGVGMRVPKEEMIAAAMRTWDQAAIETALGDDAPTVLPDAIRLVLLRARIPRYQRDMLVALAERYRTTVDEVLARELEDVACARAEDLAAKVPTLSQALAWPSQP